MSLIVKIMSSEDLLDDDTRKSYILLTGALSVEFHRRPGAPVAEILFENEETATQYPLEGNVYVMNEAGKTVSSFGVAPPLRPEDLNTFHDPQRAPSPWLPRSGSSAQCSGEGLQVGDGLSRAR